MKTHNADARLYRMFLALAMPVLMFAGINVQAEQNNTTAFAVTAAVQGDVQLTAADRAGTVAVHSGHFVYPGDRLTTGSSGQLQVLLSDGTVFTLGNNTVFSIDNFTYDPVTGDGTILARLDRGTYRVVTGRIGEVHPGNISIAMPTGMVNLRGTIVAGESDGEEDTVVLLGPGAQKNSADKQGSFAFIPKGAAVQTAEDEILVYKAGYAVTVDPDGNVSEPFEMSGRDFGQLVASLAKARGGTDEEDVNSDDDPEDLADAGDENNLEENQDVVSNDDQEAEDAVEDSEQDGKDDLQALLDAQDITKLTDLEDITGLKGSFLKEGVPMYVDGKKDKTGENTFDFLFEFGQREDHPAELDFIGFKNIQTAGNEDEDIAGIVDGELSWDAVKDLGEGEAPAFEELDFSSDPGEGQGTLTARDGCAGEDAALCEGTVTVLNAGQGNIAKFFILDLETETATFNDKLVKPGGNNNFPGSKEHGL